MISLYREAWTEFKRCFRDLLPWIAGFSLLAAVFDYCAVRDGWRLFNKAWPLIQDSIANHTKPDLTVLDSVTESQSMLDPASSLGNILEFSFSYFLVVAYLKIQPVYPDKEPVLDIADFFLWIWQRIKVGFASIGLTLVLMIGLVVLPGIVLFGLMGGIAPGENNMALAASLLGSTVLTGGVIAAICYPMVKFMLVTPLFISGEDAPLKASWRLSKGQCWQLFWNYFGLGWTLFLIFTALFLLLGGLCYAAGILTVESNLCVAVASLLWAMMTISSSALTNIFACVACKHLLHEKQNTPQLNA